MQVHQLKRKVSKKDKRQDQAAAEAVFPHPSAVVQISILSPAKVLPSLQRLPGYLNSDD